MCDLETTQDCEECKYQFIFIATRVICKSCKFHIRKISVCLYHYSACISDRLSGWNDCIVNKCVLTNMLQRLVWCCRIVCFAHKVFLCLSLISTSIYLANVKAECPLLILTQLQMLFDPIGNITRLDKAMVLCGCFYAAIKLRICVMAKNRSFGCQNI